MEIETCPIVFKKKVALLNLITFIIGQSKLKLK